MKTLDQSAQAWVDSAPRAATNYESGIQGFQGDWAGATAAQQAVMRQNLTAAIDDGRWADGVRRTGTNGWKSRTVEKIPNYRTGFAAGASRQRTAMGKILQAEANIVGSLPPRGTFQQNVDRSVQVQTQLHALKGQLKA